jgi:uncharacterized SAM-binding protein YcdF (DUF218 family)
MNPQIDALAKVLWDYNKLNHSLKNVDCIITLGSHDLRVAERGTQLYLEGYAPSIVFSGGFGRLTEKKWNKPEAEMFAEIAIRMGIPEDVIMIEQKSTNTGENFLFTRELLEKERFTISSAIVVTKPYMERRAYATVKKIWPELNVSLASPVVTYDHYPNDVISKEDVINIMVGDTQRIFEYPAKGFLLEQTVPNEVKYAYEKLIEAGYTAQLLP